MKSIPRWPGDEIPLTFSETHIFRNPATCMKSIRKSAAMTTGPKEGPPTQARSKYSFKAHFAPTIFGVLRRDNGGEGDGGETNGGEKIGGEKITGAKRSGAKRSGAKRLVAKKALFDVPSHFLKNAASKSRKHKSPLRPEVAPFSCLFTNLLLLRI